MDHTDYRTAALFEHRFWLQVLGDHGRFIYHSLSSNEQQEIDKSLTFIRIFDHLLERSHQDLQVIDIAELNQQAIQHTEELRIFKLHLLHRYLTGKIFMSLPPTFINHMINELDEYRRILHSLLSNELPPSLNPVYHHLIWLLDAIGHADTMTSSLDMVENKLKEKSRLFSKQFTDFYIKAIEMAGYLRTSLHHFPALSRFNGEVELEIILFKRFLEELKELRLNNLALGKLPPLMADHMAREECYYLIKLSQISEVKYSDCDPTAPRQN